MEVKEDFNFPGDSDFYYKTTLFFLTTDFSDSHGFILNVLYFSEHGFLGFTRIFISFLMIYYFLSR